MFISMTEPTFVKLISLLYYVQRAFGLHLMLSSHHDVFYGQPRALLCPQLTTSSPRLSSHYHFSKPNDSHALNLMNTAASHTLSQQPQIAVAYGYSDEYSFILDRATTLFDRRASKLISTLVSTFTSAYIFHWAQHFPSTPLEPDRLPSFDGRAVCYPTTANLRDYLSWRQADCHVNNLYNTAFWALVLKGGTSQVDAEQELKGTLSSDKNELLWGRFGINYNREPEMYRKGSVVFRDLGTTPAEKSHASSRPGLDSGVPTSPQQEHGHPPFHDQPHAVDADTDPTSAIGASQPSKTQTEKAKKAKRKATIVVMHSDIIKDAFWDERPWILSESARRPR